VTWHQADLTKPTDVAKAVKGMDLVVQAAATTSGSKDILTRPFIHTTDNAVMNSLLLRAAFEANVRHFVFFSCTVMYQSSEKPQKESDWNPADALHPRYFGVGHTKMYIERMLEFYAGLKRADGSSLKTTAIRHSNIYGPHDKYDLERSHVFGATVTKAMTCENELVVWGTGEEERDVLHVDDLVEFVRACLERQTLPYRLYNCGAGRAHAVRDLVHMIVEASGRQLSIQHDTSKPTIKTSLSVDCSLAAAELGWQPKVEIGTGVVRTVNWWKENIDPQTLALKQV
jgi:nucleoside-diphosphate-sugar epimerase